MTAGGVASYFRPNEADPVLPALSVQLPETEAEPLSGPEYVADVQPERPDTLSLPEKPTATAWLYHPFASAPRAGEAVTDGGVASYSNEVLFGAETSPAPLVHVSLTEADPESGPEYVAEAHVTPETDPVPVAVICTGWLYQPFESGPRAKLSAETVGVVVSSLMVTDLPVMVPSVSVTVHVTLCPAVSLEIV